MSEMPTDQLTATFSALADPTRRAILARLASGEATVNELAAPFERQQAEMRGEGAVDANEALAVVKIGEGEPVSEGEIGHQEIRPSAEGIPRISICS